MLEGRQLFSVNADATPLCVTGPNESAVSLILEVPRVIRRAFLGTLKVSAKGPLLIPVITMDREVAASSIVGAELPAAAAPFHALAAQAVVARSFLAATRSTEGTSTRNFATPRTASSYAHPRLRGLLLTKCAAYPAICFDRRRANDSRALLSCCGGHTDSRFEEGYLYQSVQCEICRQLGLPRRGHGLGLCQEGAIGLARAGWHWRTILEKYYPGASVKLRCKRNARLSGGHFSSSSACYGRRLGRRHPSSCF